LASDGDVMCTQNECVCANGHGLTGESCVANGHHGCASCSATFNLANGACISADCDKGSFKATEDATECTENECECAHGQGLMGDMCDANGDLGCASCNTGFELLDGACSCPKGSFLASDDATECTQNTCVCDYGKGLTGDSCSSNGEADCASCDLGFELQGGACSCPKGSFVASDDATECSENECACPHGEGFLGDLCATHGEVSCESCNTGFELFDGTCSCPKGSFLASNAATECTQNTCVCDHGQGLTGKLCSANGDSGCASCATSFILHTGACGCPKGESLNDGNAVCTVKQCACPHGQGSTGASCPSNGSDHCASCNENFSLSNGVCACEKGRVMSDDECVPLLCDADEHVKNNGCKRCAPGFSNSAGDDATGGDTHCSTSSPSPSPVPSASPSVESDGVSSSPSPAPVPSASPSVGSDGVSTTSPSPSTGGDDGDDKIITSSAPALSISMSIYLAAYFASWRL